MPSLFDSLPRPHRVVRPGVVHLPGFLPLASQAEIVHCAREIARSVAGTPVAMQRHQWGSGMMSAYLMPLGNAWDTRRGYLPRLGGLDVPAIPALLLTTAEAVLTTAAALDATLAPWLATFAPDTGLVNYYPPGAGMGMHQDAFEESEAPVISLSIGDTAVFRVGNSTTRTRPYQDISLLSGDALVFGGPARRIFHGVPSLKAGTSPEGCGITGATGGRINITLRQHRLAPTTASPPAPPETACPASKETPARRPE